MDKRGDIAEQIRKYLNGELDARAMHQLEKDAQNDPFLMEALEGYERVGTGQENNLSDIQARLQDLIGKKERRIIPWRMISIAASVLVILSIGGLWVKYYRPDVKPPMTAAIDKTEVVKPVIKPAQPADSIILPATPISKQPVIAAMPKNVKPNNTGESSVSNGVNPAPVTSGYIAANEYSTAKSKMVIADSANDVVIGYGTKKRFDTAGNMANITIKNRPLSNTLPGKVDGVNLSQANHNLLTGVVAVNLGVRVPGVNVPVKVPDITTQTNSDDRFVFSSVPKGDRQQFATAGYNRKAIAAGKDSLAVNLMPNNEKTIAVKGVVTAREDGQPLPGVIIKVKGTYITTLTDANGKFALRSVPVGSTLDLSYIGFETSSVPVKKQDSIFVALNSNSQSLAEVVTTGYGTSVQQKVQTARPYNGWQQYHTYFNNNAKSPDGKTGIVKLSFVVNSDNSLSDFKIIKGVSMKTDSAAVKLVKDGPRWLRNSDYNPEKVKLKIKFNGK